jgi:hypothetical protein
MGGVLLLVVIIAFTAGAAGLRWRCAKGWVVQLFPGALVARVLWNILRYR